MAEKISRRITLSDLGKEPFRVLFPQGVLAGILGVALWPLYFSGVTRFYPGQVHARIMAFGFFGGFILGFLGTAMPRLISAPALSVRNLATLSGLHLAMIAAFAAQKTFVGDSLFLILLCAFAVMMIRRASHRKDTPPPGFVLVGLAFLCSVAGAVLAVIQPWLGEEGTYWVLLQSRLSYQGFVLLPILGVGPFILPRFFRLQSHHSFDQTLVPSQAWKRKAAFALATGLLIVASFFIELRGNVRIGHITRFGAILVYLIFEFPFRHAPRPTNALGIALWTAFAALTAGFLLIAVWPGFRIALLHLTLIGGFAVITFTVAARVLFGHSGNLERLKKGNWWFLISSGLMLLGMATRISGDFWPKILSSHYTYGAVLWIFGVLLWSSYALTKVLRAEEE